MLVPRYDISIPWRAGFGFGIALPIHRVFTYVTNVQVLVSIDSKRKNSARIDGT